MTKRKHKTNPINRLLYGIAGLLTIAIVGLFGYIAVRDLMPAEAPVVPLVQDDDFSGVEVIAPPRPMPDFTLTNQHGNETSLSDLRGQPVLLFFGFTHCPDICPLTVNELKGVQADLGAAGEDVHFVFVSVDGERDSPAVLRRFFAARDVNERFIGLTGSVDDVRRISVDYGVKFFYNAPDANGNYNVDHTASTFLLDAEGRWIRKFAFGTETAIIANALQHTLNGAS